MGSSCFVQDESRNAIEYDNHYVIQPSLHWWKKDTFLSERGGKSVNDDFSYTSDTNTWWLSMKDLIKIIEKENTFKTRSLLPISKTVDGLHC